jgi:predicted nuclease of restriction endonuclease-like (RecB) superfamily
MTKEVIKGDDVALDDFEQKLFDELSTLIRSARARVIQKINVEHTLLNWHIGKTISESVLEHGRAKYGKRTLARMAKKLSNQFGKGYDRSSLSRVVRFSEYYQDVEIVATLSQQLSWSHFVELVRFEDSLKRDFYTELCFKEGWDVRTLRERINTRLYERTALANQPVEVVRKELEGLKNDTPSLNIVLRDPYVLDFLDLSDGYSERDLESAIIRELEKFILEFGRDFAFVARQKRMIIDGRDHYLDLLFFHRKLRRLIAIELKKGRFEAAHKGQMELYLRWLDKYERADEEEHPLGIILCAEKGHEEIELLALNQGEMRVAEYMTELPSRELLEKKLRQVSQQLRAQGLLDDQDEKNFE